MIEIDDNDNDTIIGMGGYSRSPQAIPMDDSEPEPGYYNQTCEYCGQEYDTADLHYVSLTYHAGKTVWRCEACRLDMKQYIVGKS